MRDMAMGCLGLGLLLLGVVSVHAAQGERPRRARTVLYKLNKDRDAEGNRALQKVLRKFELNTKRLLVGQTVRQAEASRVAGGETEEQMAAELLATGAVAFAEPDYLIAPEATPNDPSFGSQWQHAKINSPGAWDLSTGSTSVLIAVCDTGVQATHPDLQANLQLPGYNTVDNTTVSEDIQGHGTFVAGCMGAVGNNGVGVAGMAWRIRILPIRITNDTAGYAYFSDMAEGIRYAADQGAKVVNLSYGGAYSTTIDSAATYLRGKGGLLFMAASNDGVNGDTSNPVYPDFTSFVAVGATDSADVKASWSNYGSYIDLVAPGVSVVSTRWGSSYGSGSGTSFASPITAGVAALVFSINPSFSPAQVEGFLFSTAVDLGAAGNDGVYGHGRVDAFAAVQKAKNFQGNVNPVAVASASPTSGELPLAVAFDGRSSSDSDGTILSYAWNFGDGTAGSGSTASHTYTVAGTFTAVLTVTDNAGGTAQDAVAITVTDPNLIAAPSNLAASVASRTVSLTWLDNATNETTFYVERATKVKGSLIFAVVATLGQNTQAWSQTVSAGTHVYRVRAYNLTSNRYSTYSNQVQVRVR